MGFRVAAAKARASAINDSLSRPGMHIDDDEQRQRWLEQQSRRNTGGLRASTAAQMCVLFSALSTEPRKDFGWSY